MFVADCIRDNYMRGRESLSWWSYHGSPRAWRRAKQGEDIIGSDTYAIILSRFESFLFLTP